MASLRLGSAGLGAVRRTGTRGAKSSAVEFAAGSAELLPWKGDPTAKAPQKVRLEAGKTYAWCACGNSKRQPWCDGSHKRTGNSLRPVVFTAKQDKEVMLCLCRQTGNKPFCDGSHRKMEKGPLSPEINDYHVYRTDEVDKKDSVAWNLGYHHKNGIIHHRWNRV